LSFLIFPSLSVSALVIHETALLKYPEFAANIISGCEVRGSELVILEPSVVWDGVFNNSIGIQLDAYRARQAPAVFADLLAGNVLAIKRSANRVDNVFTIFVDTPEGLQVTKLSQALLLEGGGEELIRLAPKEEVYAGVGIDIVLYRKAGLKDWVGVVQCLQGFFDEVFSRYSVSSSALRDVVIDMIPRNALVDVSGRVVFFDIEFVGAGDVEKTFFIYRVCISVMGKKGYLFAGCGFDCIYDVYMFFCKYYALKCDIKLEIKRELEFQARVNGSSKTKLNFFWALKTFSLEKGFAVRFKKRLRRIRVKYF
jgi:hypothetical protein